MNRIPGSDEEDDIESLRLAALQSLKRRESFSLNSDSSPHFRGKGSRNKWGRFGSHQRPGKTGHFSRHRNTNLIPIMPIGTESDAETEKKSNLLKVASSESVNKENSSKEVGCSKFTRYNKSESESEGDETTSDENQPGKLKKSDSLEALMQELDEEIKGKQIDGETQTTKEVTQNEKITEQSSSGVETQVELLNKAVEPTKEEENTSSADVKSIAEDTSSIKVDTGINKFERKNIFPRKHFKSKSPNSRFFHKKRRMYHNPNMSSPPHHMPFNFNLNPFGPPIMPFMNPPQHNPMFMQTNVSQPPPLYFERPISPLSINTDSLTTATMAPLSPRSARFVLENKAIIERRKRSPRRSYSRSPSRSLSRSPRYSPSPPRRFRRSVSPRRLSRSPRRFSPRKRSLSPRRRSPSPKRENPPISQQTRPQNRPKPKPEKVEENKPKETDVPKVEEEQILDPILLARKKKFESNEIKKKEGIIRLKPKDDKPVKSETTTKSADSKAETSTSLSNESQKPNEIKTSTKSTSKGTPKTEQPKPKTDDSKGKMEEAKGKMEEAQGKTEKAETKTKELKVKEEPKATEDPLEFQELERLLLNEDAPLDELDVQHKVADIFSDEESDSDNEGRFKMKEKRTTVPVLSFSKLVNGVKQEIKREALPDSSGTRRGRDRDRDRRRRSTPIKQKPSETRQDHKKERIQPTSSEPQTKRQKITFKSDPMPSIENRADNKIEIKIKNPSKYEKTEKIKSKVEPVVEKSKIIHINEDDDDDDVEALIDEEEEIILENDSGDEENAVLTEGDLRTQLSRKRAEKLYKIPAEEVSTRILKFALQGAVFKKSKKKSKKKSSSEAKLPIHLRLGLNSTKDIFEDVKVKKKSKKRKAREVLEQKAPSKYMKNLQLE
ncbi:unnamed protein product [Psylliodes chrysocephalus]|uniref:Uncharacterized protein n=1 Tax=Psylliodes chrysocephalus TaxID=3402493 RepID=A0A9P0D175_9CUCU|nr:unnamed protein product [Psylliodes chrysocephala]